MGGVAVARISARVSRAILIHGIAGKRLMPHGILFTALTASFVSAGVRPGDAVFPDLT